MRGFFRRNFFPSWGLHEGSLWTARVTGANYRLARINRKYFYLRMSMDSILNPLLRVPVEVPPPGMPLTARQVRHHFKRNTSENTLGARK